jgi:hypothetical protein
MDFGEVLSKAWKIVWKFKILWIFGILASCGTRGGGGFSGGGNYQTNSTPGQLPNVPNIPPGLEDNLLKFVQFFENPAVIAVFLSLICVLILLTVFLTIMGRIGLIKGAVEADGGAERLSFGELWKSGLHYFWRVLGLSLLIGSPILLFYLALVIGGLLIFVTYLSGSQGSSLGAAAPALLALIPVICLVCVVVLLAIVISFLAPQAERAIVIENEGVISGLRRGWNVLTKNLGPVLIIWFITVVIGVAAGILVALPLFIILVPALIAFVAGGNNPSFTPLIIAGLCLVAYIPVSLVANGILTAYLESVWTLTYLRLTQPESDGQTAFTPQNA